MTPLHLGIGRDSYDVAASVMQSDMLSAALASVRALHGKAGSTLAFLSTFALSSAFPYDGKEFFLPRMKGLLPISVRHEEEKDYRKKLKKLSYISMPLWLKLAKGERLEIDDNQLQGAFLLAEGKADYHAPMTHVVTERVSVSRSGEEDAVPFMFDWTFFKHNDSDESKTSGLYCLLKADIDTAKEITELFSELGELGIGSDKSVGGGHFSVETDTVDIPSINSDKQILLSTYIPTKEELDATDLQSSTYQLIHRGGFIAGSNNETLRHLRRKTIFMFDAGSILATGKSLEGAIVDLKPEWNSPEMHPVYRSGRPIALHIL